MKMLFIYGPPATGKLTVAEEITKKNDFKIFHNHLTIELAKSLFEKSNLFKEYRDKLRLEYIEMAVRNNINIIFTFCYAPITEDNEFVKKVIEIIERNMAQIYFVHLHSKKEILNKRVIKKSRKKFSKISKTSSLKETINKYDFYQKIPFVKSLNLENDRISAKLSAKKILEYIK